MAQSRYYSSTAQPTVLTGSITPASTTIVVAAVTGFPVSVPYVLALDYATASEELVLVTAAAGTSLTVTRAYDGTSATSHNVAANVRHTWAAADGNDSRFHEGSTGGVHGIAGISAVVGTTDVQTLSNKTLTAPIINSGTFSGTTALASPSITGTVTGGASYTTITATNPNITGTVTGGAITLMPTFQADVDANPSEIVKKRSATQTGALTSWRDDVGTSLAFVTSAGISRWRQGLTAGTADAFSVDVNGNVSTIGIGAQIRGVATANQVATSTTVQAANPTIVMAMAANATYKIEGYISYDGDTASNGGIKIGWTFPAGATGSFSVNGPGVSGVAPIQYQPGVSAISGTQPGGTYGVGSMLSLSPNGWVSTAAAAGNLTLTMAQNVSSATSTTLYSGSYIIIRRVA